MTEALYLMDAVYSVTFTCLFLYLLLFESEVEMPDKQKWGGFQRSFTRTVDRDPNPSIPFVTCEPFPLPSAKVSIVVTVLILGLIGVLAWA